jgi:hypothetical protein
MLIRLACSVACAIDGKPVAEFVIANECPLAFGDPGRSKVRVLRLFLRRLFELGKPFIGFALRDELLSIAVGLVRRAGGDEQGQREQPGMAQYARACVATMPTLFTKGTLATTTRTNVATGLVMPVTVVVKSVSYRRWRTQRFFPRIARVNRHCRYPASELI